MNKQSYWEIQDFHANKQNRSKLETDLRRYDWAIDVVGDEQFAALGTMRITCSVHSK